MKKVRWLSKQEERTWRALQFMQLQLNAELSRQLDTESGLSYSDYVVLVALTDRPDGRLRPFELGQILGWEKSRVSHHVTRMTNRGLVSKAVCDTDGRGGFVVISDRGRQEIEVAAPGHVEAVRRLFIDRLRPDQLEVIAEAAETVLAALESERQTAGRSTG